MMRTWVFLCLALLASSVLGASKNLRDDWRLVAPAPQDYEVHFRVALVQDNMDQLEETFWAVNTPGNPRYGQFLTAEEILAIVAPGNVRQDRVVAYIREHSSKKIHIETYGDALLVFMRVSDVNALFSTEMYTFVHNETGAARVLANIELTIPAAIRSDVVMVTGLSGFPIPAKTRQHPEIRTKGTATYVVAESLYDIYNYGDLQADAESSLCLAEFTNYESYIPSELARFQTQNNLASNTISTAHTVGAFHPSGSAIESNLDVQFGLASARNVTGWYWTEAVWMYDFANALFAEPNPPLVASISWGWSEDQQCSSVVGSCDGNRTETSREYVHRTDNEFMKLGTLGITVVACSQDEGAAGTGNPGCSDPKNPFNPQYPATSPYVLSVGATMLANQTVMDVAESSGAPPICSKYDCATAGVEVVCTYPEALITSGGGFSNYNTMPSYQQAAVEAYFASGVTMPPSSMYNASNRGVPDIAAMGHNYLIYTGGSTPEPVDGTSCSTPVIAGVMAVINGQRMKGGLAPLGFANPLIYQIWADTPDAFHDVTIGNNKCTEECCLKVGYEAAVGWDACTGVGTPNVQNLVAAAVALGAPKRQL